MFSMVRFCHFQLQILENTLFVMFDCIVGTGGFAEAIGAAVKSIIDSFSGQIKNMAARIANRDVIHHVAIFGGTQRLQPLVDEAGNLPLPPVVFPKDTDALNAMKVAEINALAKFYGLVLTGAKPERLARLKRFLVAG
jgi:hypothetical protein